MGKIKTSLQRLLDARDSKWQQEQKKLKALHIEERLDRGKKREDYINKILAKCKTWNRPFTAFEEMESSLKSLVSEDKVKEVLLRHELMLQKYMHLNDAIERKELINKQSMNSMIYNLNILLSNDIQKHWGRDHITKLEPMVIWFQQVMIRKSTKLM